MGRPARNSPPRLLTDVELELMSILWKLEKGTVHDVLAELPRSRKLAYTSVSTILRVLESKRLVRSRKIGRSHEYRPAVSKPDYERRSIRHLVENVFDGTPQAMVSRLVDDQGLTRDELEELQRLVTRRLREQE